MGRHQRHGYVGQTNLLSPHKHPSHDERSRVQPSLEYKPSDRIHAASTTRKRQLRAKWRLDLAPVVRTIEPFTRPHVDSTEAALAIGIEAAQHDHTSYKDEPWYRSPIGAGSKSSVLLAALKQHDVKGTGFISRDRVLQTRQQRQFDLSEPQIQQLLKQYDPTSAQEQIHYATFARQLHFADPISTQPDDHDIIFRHQRYLEKIRDHATHLIQLSEAVATGSPKRLSPLRRALEPVTNCEPSVVVGTSPVSLSHTGGSVSPSKLLLPCEDDLLSYVNDTHWRHHRAQAKAAILLVHRSHR